MKNDFSPLLRQFFLEPSQGAESRFEKTLKYFLVVLVAAIVLYPHLRLARVPAVGDELRLISTEVAEGRSEGLNPFHPRYVSVKYPPGLPVTFFLWMQVFGKSYLAVHCHLLAISFLTLLFLYMFSSLYLPFLSSLGVVVLFGYTDVFYEFAHRSAGGMHFALFFILSMYFLAEKNARALQWTLLGAAFFFAKAVALPLALLCLAPFYEKNEFSFKKILGIVTPSLVFIMCYSAINYYLYGVFLKETHIWPYTLDSGSSIFSFGITENRNIKDIWNWWVENIPSEYVFVLLGVLLLFTKKYSFSGPQKKALLGFLIALAWYLILCVFIEVTVKDQIVLLTMAVTFFFALGLEKVLYKKVGVFCLFALSLQVAYGKSVQTREFDIQLAEKVAFIKTAVQYMRAHYPAKRVCTIGDLTNVETIHGYDFHKDENNMTCQGADVVCGASILEMSPKKMEKMREWTQSQNLKLAGNLTVKSRVFKLKSSQLECYSDPRLRELTLSPKEL